MIQQIGTLYTYRLKASSFIGVSVYLGCPDMRRFSVYIQTMHRSQVQYLLKKKQKHCIKYFVQFQVRRIPELHSKPCSGPPTCSPYREESSAKYGIQAQKLKAPSPKSSFTIFRHRHCRYLFTFSCDVSFYISGSDGDVLIFRAVFGAIYLYTLS